MNKIQDKKINRLAREESAYLKHAASQGIDWYPWCEEAFETAEQEDKPIFMSTGAIWCHWCHVMAKECFEDKEIIKLLNENFINIKLDRDERPDIDRLYQMAVAAMGAGGGWPLSVFLTHDKKPFFGGTYFPPEDRFGRPGFKSVLKSVTELYKSRKQEVSQYTEKLINALKPEPAVQGEINESLVDTAVKNILAESDAQNGGFGSAPKFPMPGTIEFLINRYVLTRKESIGYAVRKTLEAIAKGGFHDQIGGGFHRYSTDEYWIIPHFEKMADDNAWLLRNYIHAYSVFGDEYFKEVANGIINFIRDVLSGNDGSFYASQDADVTPDDEGGYFTWTDKDFKKALSEEEHMMLSLHLLNEQGAMHHDKSKKVLFIAMSAEEIAEKSGRDPGEVKESIKSGKAKLLKQRNKRESPFIDRTFYTSLNGMLVTACLMAYRALGEESVKDFALKCLDKIIKDYFTGDELFHSKGVKALLEDHVNLAEALTSAYEVTGDLSYINKAVRIMDLCIEKFWDRKEGGFFETDSRLLGIRLKGVEDISHPSANSSGIMVLLKLFHLTGGDAYRQYAEKALKAFSSKAAVQGIMSGYYFASLDAYFNMLKLNINTTEKELTRTAISSFSPYTTLAYGEDKGCVIPCFKDTCHEPIDNPDSLRSFLKKRKYLPDVADIKK